MHVVYVMYIVYVKVLSLITPVCFTFAKNLTVCLTFEIAI